MNKIILVMIGGGIGATIRHLLTILLNRLNFKHWSTFVINVTGSFIAGHALSHLNSFENILVTIGLLGGYTTFSTFSYENIDLIAHEKYVEFLKYAIASCFICVIFSGLGYFYF